MAKVSDIKALLTPSIEALGYVLWGVEYLRQGRYSVLRVYIDHPNGISVDDCETVSRQIDLVLDVEDPINGEYTLEVSSPGLERPLYEAAQYALYIGQKASITLKSPLEGRKNFAGTIVSVKDKIIGFEVEGKSYLFDSDNIAKAHLVF
jgi:ribosome maturation factor RimP